MASQTTVVAANAYCLTFAKVFLMSTDMLAVERMAQRFKRGTGLLLADIFLCLIITGCNATVSHLPEAQQPQGIRYYESAPFVIIYSDGHGGLNWQIRYLPDQTRIMTALPKIDLAHTEMTLYFQNGILASSSVVADTTEIPKALISAVQSAIPLMAAAAAQEHRPPGFPAPYLYKVVVHGNHVDFIGGQAKQTINGQPQPIKIQVPLPQGLE